MPPCFSTQSTFLIFVIWFYAFGAGLFLSIRCKAQTRTPRYSEGIEKCTQFINRMYYSADEIREMVIKKNKHWPVIELLSQTELPDSNIQMVFRYQTNGRGNAYDFALDTITTTSPRGLVFTSLNSNNTEAEKFTLQQIMDEMEKIKIVYDTDLDYRKIIQIIEKEVVSKLSYDFQGLSSSKQRSFNESVSRGKGLCWVYAKMVTNALAKEGYVVESWGSETGDHAWNEVTLPGGKRLYIDATWYDRIHTGRSSSKEEDNYSPWFITYNKALFEHGFSGILNIHGAWPDAEIMEF